MDRRAFERIPVNMQARLFYGNMIYAGIVTDVSENGMFICTKMKFPVNAVLIAILREQGKTFSLPIKVRRTVTSHHFKDHDRSGLGVGLMSPPQGYITFITAKKTSQ